MSDEIILKLELNKGRRGIVLQKLARIVEETEKFLESFADDLNLNKTDWLAEKFENGSLSWQNLYLGEAEPKQIANGKEALAVILSPESDFETVSSFGISQKTFLQFSKIASPLDVDEFIGVASMNGNGFISQELSKKRALQIQNDVSRTFEEYAGFQGTITALFKDNNSFWLKDYLTNNRIVCEFAPSQYSEIWRYLEKRDVLVNVEGWYHVKDNESRLKITDISELPQYQEGDLEAFFGADKDFTGDLTTAEYIDQIRGDE
jgi:hypothetical protein